MYIDFNTIITTIVSTLSTALVAWLIAHLTSFLKAKAENERAKKQLSEIDEYRKIANQTVADLVDYLNNTVVNEMKTASEDGTLTDDESAQIKNACKCKLYGTLSDNSLEALKNVYGTNLDSIFDIWIENAVASAKCGGTGLDKTAAFGIAKMQNTTAEQKEAIKEKLNSRLETIVDTTSSC